MLTQFVINNWYLFLALVVVIGLLAYDPVRTWMLNIGRVSPLDVPRLMSREGAVVVDVCEPHEYKDGHIAGAINIPLSRLADELERLKKYRKKPVVLCCRSGQRAVKGAVTLRKSGFESVYNLAGGIQAWQKENLPVEKA